jgi:transcriptional regulator with XRE-family HTH domain
MNPGHRLKERRVELGMSVAQLARSAGIAASTLYDLERGVSRSSRQMHRLCSSLGLNPDWVETGAGPRLVGEEPAENTLEITYRGARITPEAARLAAQIERLDDVVRAHIEGMINSLIAASDEKKKP